MAVQGGLLKSSRSAARSARAPCISACTAVCAPRRRRRKTRASCVVAQTAARLARWLEGARELPGGERGHANCEGTGGNCTTPTSADRALVGGAREDAARVRMSKIGWSVGPFRLKLRLSAPYALNGHIQCSNGQLKT